MLPSSHELQKEATKNRGLGKEEDLKKCRQNLFSTFHMLTFKVGRTVSSSNHCMIQINIF